MFEWGALRRPAVMGVVNVTPDSFSDGGRFIDVEAAVSHGRALVREGADLLDVGGESTRPGAEPVAADVERRRVLPVIRALVSETGVPVSVDTTKAVVAQAALEAGATVVNDVSAGRGDPRMLALVADAGSGYVAMHMRGQPRTMQDEPRYDDVVAEVAEFLVGHIETAQFAGIAAERLAADPGIGFGKKVEHNLALLGALDVLRDRVGVPLMIGTSRKRFIAAVVGGQDPGPLHREEGTLASVAWAIEHGVDVVRVHDVAPSARLGALARNVAA